MMILAIDPGAEKSALVFHDGIEHAWFEICENEHVFSVIKTAHQNGNLDRVIIEKVESFMLKVGETIFETVRWSGRFEQFSRMLELPVERIPRKTIKMHLCGNSTANDSAVIAAIANRLDPYQRFGKQGKGTKKNIGPCYGFKKDIWQAYAVALTWLDFNNQAERLKVER